VNDTDPMTTTENTRKGVCRVCRLPSRIGPDGRLLPHPQQSDPMVSCDGAGYFPLPEATR
jgi:hypothetical protein